jgi:hypothetical protein
MGCFRAFECKILITLPYGEDGDEVGLGTGAGYRACASHILQIGLTSRNGKYSVNGILQSIFRSAARRETPGRHPKGGRRGGELKIDWTKPLPRA